MITELMVGALMMATPLTPQKPGPEIPKQCAILEAEEEKVKQSRKDRRADLKRK